MQGWRSGVETCWRWWTSRTSGGGRPANCPVRRPALASFLPPADSRGEEQKIQAAHQDATSSDPALLPDVQQHVQQKQLVFPLPSSVFLSQQAEGAVVEPAIPRPHLHQGL